MYEVLQAVQAVQAVQSCERGQLRMHDVPSLALTCRQHCQWLQPWVAQMHSKHVSSVRTFKYSTLERSLPWVNVYVTEWDAFATQSKAVNASPAAAAAASVRVFINRADSDTLGAICDWLGNMQPKHLLTYFFTYNLSKTINSCLT